MHDYGPPRDARELERWTALVGSSFSFPAAELPAWRAQLGEGTERALRIDGELAAVLGVLDMGQWFGGRRVPMGGVLAVGVEPSRRGRGLGLALMTELLRELRARGVPLSALYPATNTLYRAAGYEIAGARHEFALRLRELSFARGATAARDTWLRPARDADEPALRALYRERARTSSGWLDRHEYLWRRVRSWRGEERQGFVAGRGERVEGYAFLAQRRGELLQMDVAFSDLVATTRDSGVRLLELLRDHRSLCTLARGFLAVHDPIVALLGENGFESKLSMPWMLRVVDVAAALEARGYPAGLAATLELDVTDDVLPENAGRWVVAIADGAARVERGGRGTLALDMRALAGLYTGWQSAHDLAAGGRAAGPEDVLARATASFAGPAPHMPDMF
ncbi:MAG: GNAT family N-acetyltransferase [Planctomycetes bacterium]|nr:GNAT family N-acetyltransferase [Planctomycetota bacterium]